LVIFPTWPEGQFNLAFLCGETGDYGCAVEHMQDYLELVPDAPDAQAAKDKLIIWKDKLNSGQIPAAPPNKR
jgi:predicted TPR repeat methyltransferase